MSSDKWSSITLNEKKELYSIFQIENKFFKSNMHSITKNIFNWLFALNVFGLITILAILTTTVGKNIVISFWFSLLLSIFFSFGLVFIIIALFIENKCLYDKFKVVNITLDNLLKDQISFLNFIENSGKNSINYKLIMVFEILSAISFFAGIKLTFIYLFIKNISTQQIIF